MVDGVDIGLLNATETTGRRRLEKTISDFSDAIIQGLSGTVGSFGFGVMSLRQCASRNGVNDGCSNGTVLATGTPDFVRSTSPKWISANLNLIIASQAAIASVYILASFL